MFTCKSQKINTKNVKIFFAYLYFGSIKVFDDVGWIPLDAAINKYWISPLRKNSFHHRSLRIHSSLVTLVTLSLFTYILYSAQPCWMNRMKKWILKINSGFLIFWYKNVILIFKFVFYIFDGDRFWKHCSLLLNKRRLVRLKFIHSRSFSFFFLSIIMPSKKGTTAKATTEIDIDTKQNQVSVYNHEIEI